MLLHARLLSAQSYLDTTGNVCRTAVMTPLQCTPINYTRTLSIKITNSLTNACRFSHSSLTSHVFVLPPTLCRLAVLWTLQCFLHIIGN